MKKKRWSASENSVFNIRYHIIWCVKYRRRVLVGEIEKRFKELLSLKADELGIVIEYMEVMPDHVNFFVIASPVDGPHYIVQQLKGYTSREMRNEFSTLKSRIPSLWTRSYYIESIGDVSKETIKRYIDNQKNV